MGVQILVDVKGGPAETLSSNSFPSRTVLSSTRNALLVHWRSESVNGSSRLLTIFTMRVSLVWSSGPGLNIAYIGVTSIGLQIVPLIWRAKFVWAGSLLTTNTFLETVPT